MSEFAIDAQCLVKSYSGTTVVQDVSLQVRKGSIFGLLGPNGAGKSTTVSILTGLIQADSGTVSIHGVPLHPGSLEARRLVGVVPDGLALFEYLSIWDNLGIIREAWSMDVTTFETRARDLLALFALDSDLHKEVRKCSYGMRKKVALAMALLPNPRVLVLDEPFEGLDPVMSKVLESSLKMAARRGITILITSHALSSMQDLLQHYGILRAGRLVASGEIASLVGGGLTLQEAYLREFQVGQIRELQWLG